jgi:CBS domain-containing protein
MKVAELMSPSIITVERQTPLRHVLQLMLRFHLNDVLVVDNRHDLAGIVTYSDLIRSLLPSETELMEHQEYISSPESMEDRFQEWAGTPVDRIMTERVITVSPDIEVLKAGAIMSANHVKQLPVVRDHGLIGIISYADIGWGLISQNCQTVRARVSAGRRHPGPSAGCSQSDNIT